MNSYYTDRKSNCGFTGESYCEGWSTDMKISEIYTKKKKSLSFEIFPVC